MYPNLPVDPEEPEGKKGILLSAVRGEGATIVCLFACHGISYGLPSWGVLHVLNYFLV